MKSDSVPHSLSPRMWVTVKDFLADPTQWPLGCVLFGHSLSLSETALQADREHDSQGKGATGVMEDKSSRRGRS